MVQLCALILRSSVRFHYQIIGKCNVNGNKGSVILKRRLRRGFGHSFGHDEVT
jgi:hypothetical protein